jgi:hypothetical protein
MHVKQMEIELGSGCRNSSKYAFSLEYCFVEIPDLFASESLKCFPILSAKYIYSCEMAFVKYFITATLESTEWRASSR